MGEVVRTLRLSDRVRLTRGGLPLWRDGVEIDGDAEALLDRPAVAAGGRALATLLYAAPDADIFGPEVFQRRSSAPFTIRSISKNSSCSRTTPTASAAARTSASGASGRP